MTVSTAIAWEPNGLPRGVTLSDFDGFCLSPVRETGDGDVTVCCPYEAGFWSVYGFHREAQEWQIVHDSPNVAMELLDHKNLDVEIVGGRLLRHSVVTSGAATIAWLDRYRPDICFIGATGLHPDQGITTGVSDEAEVKRAIIARSGSALILASSEKFGAVSSFKIGGWGDVDGLIVTKEARPKALELFGHLGCEIHFSESA